MSVEEQEVGKVWVIAALKGEAERMDVSIGEVEWLESSAGFNAGFVELKAVVDGHERRERFTEEELEDVATTSSLQMTLRHYKLRQMLYRRP